MTLHKRQIGGTPIQEASPIVGSGCKLQQLLDVQPAKIKATVYAFEFNPDIAVRAFDLPEMTLPALGAKPKKPSRMLRQRRHDAEEMSIPEI